MTQACDTLWINDPTTGAFLLPHDRVVYDVTDDWRSAQLRPRDYRRLVIAEDLLARRARTVVCSKVLRQRWKERYDIDAVVVNNAVDVAAIRLAHPRDLGEDRPHIGYVGTLHDERLDVALVLQTADALATGQVYLVGPDCLSASSRDRLLTHPRIVLQGSVPSCEVPSWLVAFDVLISPHVVSPFTLSLDAIKSYEYLATPRPVVATPTSGFQDLNAPGLLVTADDFPASVCHSAEQTTTYHRELPDWNERTRQFAAVLQGADTHA